MSPHPHSYVPFFIWNNFFLHSFLLDRPFLNIFSPCPGQSTSRTKKRLLSLFSEVIQNEPSVLVLEDLDHAMPHVSDAQEQVQEEGNNSINKTQVRFACWGSSTSVEVDIRTSLVPGICRGTV
jgi:hypothetical protein